MIGRRGKTRFKIALVASAKAVDSKIRTREDEELSTENQVQVPRIPQHRIMAGDVKPLEPLIYKHLPKGGTIKQQIMVEAELIYQ